MMTGTTRLTKDGIVMHSHGNLGGRSRTSVRIAMHGHDFGMAGRDLG